MKTPLHDAVRDYIEKDMSRFHMPGHKGAGTDEFAALLPWDITEVEGADSLYHAEGPLLALEEQFARLYGTRRTLLCAGGATLCIQTMLALACGTGAAVVMGRNLHPRPRSTRRHCSISPPCGSTPNGTRGRGSPDGIPRPRSPPRSTGIRRRRRSISPRPTISACSAIFRGLRRSAAPTGCRCSSTTRTARTSNSCRNGTGKPPSRRLRAALCCDSLHKTMPAMTGGALLHICDERYARTPSA